MLSQIKENLRETLRSAGVALSLFDLIEHTGVSADTLQTALNQIENSDELIQELERETAQHYQALLAAGEALTNARKAAG